MMCGRSPSPRSLDDPLNAFLGSRLAPSESSVPALYRETTICYAYMCPYAYGCTEKSVRPAQVLTRRCIRYLPDEIRIKAGLSGLALDLLAKRRERGQRLNPATASLLDKHRPDGPMRKWR